MFTNEQNNNKRKTKTIIQVNVGDEKKNKTKLNLKR